MVIDETMMTAILGLAALVWALMEGVCKPFIYKTIMAINAKLKWNIDEQYKPVIVRVVAALIGIAFVWGADGGVSFAEMWGIEIINYHWFDVISTGIVVSLGNKGIHWLIDLIRDNGDLIKVLMTNKANGVPNA